MGLEEKRYELELFKVKIDGERNKREKFKFWLTIITVIITLSGATFSVWKYFDEKAKERMINYKESLSNLNSSNPNTLRLAIKEISKYENYYAESIPILIEIYLNCDDSTYHLVEKDISISISTIGEPFINYLKNYSNNDQELNASRQNVRLQKILIEVLRLSRVFQKSITLNSFTISSGDLSNFTIVKVIFNNITFKNIDFTSTRFHNCVFSGVVFENCIFWRAEFQNSNTFNEIEFKSCNLQDSFILPDCSKCSFVDCNVLNMTINLKSSDSDKIFSNCEQQQSIKFIN